MKSRLLVAAVGIPLLLVILFACPEIVTALAISFLSAVGAREMLRTTGIVPHPRMIAYSMIMGVLVPLWSYVGSPILPGAAVTAAFALLLFAEAMAAYPAVKFESVTGCLFAGIVIPLCLSSIVRILLQEQGRYLVLVPILIPFLADAGAYFVGCSFGKHKLAPVLSPNKSVEGAIGGVATGIVSVLLYGLALQFGFHLKFRFLYGILYGVLGSLVSILGDLSFSMVKRETGIKDYGTLFRAHGGVLDRFDSVIFAAPVVELLLLLLPLLD